MADKVKVLPTQTGLLPVTTTVGFGFTLTATLSVAVHPFASVTVIT
ncbi:MAG: hypothetical protein IPN49_10810 [Saprospiraceae bacterium]|nr:hypothetical protein [Saprospiraceae bacterium]